MMRVSNKTAHGITSPLPRVKTRQFATAEKGRSAVARFLVTILSLFPFLVVFATNANPASALVDIPIPSVLTPASLTTAVTDGVGTVSAALSAAAGSSAVITAADGAAIVGAPVAAAGVGAMAGAAAVGLGTGYGIGTGLRLLWQWGAGHDPTYADPPSTPVEPNATPSGGTATVPTDYCRMSGHPDGIASCVPGHTVVSGTYQVVIAAETAYASCNSNCNNQSKDGLGIRASYVNAPTTDFSPGNWDQLYVTAKYYDDSTFGCGQYAYGNTAPMCPHYHGTSPDASRIKYWYVKNGTNKDVALFGVPGEPLPNLNPPPTNPGTQQITTTPTTQCKPPGGSPHNVTNGSIVYTGATPSSTLPAIIEPACPDGEQVIGFSTPSTGAGGATVPSPLAPWTAPTIPNGFPECQPIKSCQLTLLQVSPTGTTEICNNNDLCDGWQTQPQRAPSRTVKKTTTGADAGTDISTLPPTDPEGNHYECHWGPYELEAKECTTVPTNKPAGVPDTGTGTGTDDGCFAGMGISPLTWPKGLIMSPLKCLFIPKEDAMSRWSGQVDTIKGSGIFSLFDTFGNFVKTVVTAGNTAYACPTESPGQYSDGRVTVTKQSPIHWCDIIVAAGTETQSTTWGLAIYNGARIILFVWFAIYWYNRIAASAGSQSEL